MVPTAGTEITPEAYFPMARQRYTTHSQNLILNLKKLHHHLFVVLRGAALQPPLRSRMGDPVSGKLNAGALRKATSVPLKSTSPSSEQTVESKTSSRKGGSANSGIRGFGEPAEWKISTPLKQWIPEETRPEREPLS